MKKIGIILNENRSISDKEIYSINRDLIKFLNRYNLLVIEFVIDNVDFEKSKKIIDKCDGIILPGGDNPNKNINKIIKYLYITNKPTLGICLGMQELALFFDGKYNRLLTNKHQSSKEYVHEVIIDDNSLLYKILGKKRIMVNSRHNDYITYTKASRVAYSKDYIIEAIEVPNHKFMVGVQWHPESLYFDNNSIKLFDYFINIL